MKTPAHSNPKYLCARIKKLFVKQGWPISKTTGVYSPFYSTQKITEGFRVHKIGCSKTVNVHYYTGSRVGAEEKEVRMRRQGEAWEFLRGLGYRVDEKGWIECDGYDECDE